MDMGAINTERTRKGKLNAESERRSCLLPKNICRSRVFKA